MNPFKPGSLSHAAWAILTTKKGARLSLSELAQALEEKTGRAVTPAHAGKLRSRLACGDRTFGQTLDLPDLRFQKAS